MAEAIAGKILGKQNVMSAGTYTGAPDEPEGQTIKDLTIYNQNIPVKFMMDNGYKAFGDHKTKKVTDEMINSANIIVDMTEDPYDLEVLKNNPKVIKWEVENPLFQNYDKESGYRKSEEIYKILEQNIQNLLMSYKAYCSV